MSNRLDQEREATLQPTRIQFCKEQIEALGYQIHFEDATRIKFMFKDNEIVVFPYSGWCTGKTIKDCRGIQNLLNQIQFQPGTKVHYCMKGGATQNGMIKSISDVKTFAFVVYHCAGDWENYKNYTGAGTNFADLKPGWTIQKSEA